MSYFITKTLDGRWHCRLCSHSEGVQEWNQDTRHDAVAGMIKAAKVYNNAIIRDKDIEFPVPAPSKDKTITEEEYSFLQAIKRGQKVVLEKNDLRLKSEVANITKEELEKVRNITDEELSLLEKIRNGNIRYVEV